MLINDIETLKFYIPTIIGDDIAIYSHSLEESERWLEFSILGPIYKDLGDGELKRLCSEIVAFRTYADMVPKLDLVNTPNGFAIVNTDKLAPASRDRVNALRDSVIQSQLAAEIRLYEYLEDKQYETWQECPGSTIIPMSLINTRRQFRNYGVLSLDYSQWRESRPKHRLVLSNYIYPVISRELTDILVLSGNIQTVHNQKIIDDVRSAFACYFNDDLINGDAFISSVRQYLRAHIEDYPEYGNSAQNKIYSPPEQSTGILFF